MHICLATTGQAPKPLGNPATPSSAAASAQNVPSSLTQDQIEATGNKQVKPKTQRQRRRPSRTQGVATQQRKQQQLKQHQQQQQYLQQQQQQQQQPGMYIGQPGQPLPQQMNQGQFYQQMSSANTLPGQAQLTVPSRYSVHFLSKVELFCKNVDDDEEEKEEE